MSTVSQESTPQESTSQESTPAAEPVTDANSAAKKVAAKKVIELPQPEEVAELRTEIDDLDREILRLVKRRAEVSQRIGAARMAAGGPRIVVNREMDVLARYRELGQAGRMLAMALLDLGRGKLGR